MSVDQTFRTVLDSLDEPQLIVRSDYTIAYANQAFRRRFGLVDHVGRRCHEVLFHELQPCSVCGEACPLDRALVSNQAETLLRRELVPGGERFLEITVTPVPDADGTPAFFMERVLVRGGNTFGAGAGIVARSPAVRAVLQKLSRITSLDVPVLFVGASGTGKERFAKTLHENSRRAANAFIVMNCDGLTEGAFEAECLGAVDGSGRRQGGLASQPGGTLYFDEVALLSKPLQRRLVQLIESGMVRACGSAEARAVDYRILCATKYDLRERTLAGAFRKDLYYLLSGCRVNVPCLNDRIEDIEELAQEIMRTGAAPQKPLTTNAIDYLQLRRWDGNVRELEAFLERAALFSDAEKLDRAELEKFEEEPLAALSEQRRVPVPTASVGLDGSSEAVPEARRRLTATQTAALMKALSEWNGSKRALARHFGISERTLYRLLRKHNYSERD